mmetsp:Transcript_6997/g.19895  ORF Transcript_6997/g.19895 Transcript_6997/m.19895 type:complete len:494 (+) Transcript_6997:160-1641(+)
MCCRHRAVAIALCLGRLGGVGARRYAAPRSEQTDASATGGAELHVEPSPRGASALLEASIASAARWTGFKDVAIAAPLLVAKGRQQLHGGALPDDLISSGRSKPNLHPAIAAGGRPGTELHGFLDGMPSEGPPFTERSFTQPSSSEEQLREVAGYDPQGLLFDVKVPEMWAESFEEGSVEHMAHSWTSDVYSARLRSDPSIHVAFKAMNKDDPKARRELHMRHRLASMGEIGMVRPGNIAPLLDKQFSEDKTFLLFPKATAPLAAVLQHRLGNGPATPGSPLLTMQEAFPVMIDVLRGLRHLEEAGIIHADLSEDNILLIGGRAYISDLGTSCLDHSGDSGFDCNSLVDEPGSFVGSAYRQAPEMTLGMPTGYSNTVWSLGLIFARIALGRMPTEIDGPYTAKLDREEHGRKQIRRIISEEFRIEEMAGFDKSPRWIQELLSGMLSKDVEKRWTSEQALTHTTTVAKALGVPVLDEPAPIRLPVGWYAEAAWQ